MPLNKNELAKNISKEFKNLESKIKNNLRKSFTEHKPHSTIGVDEANKRGGLIDNDTKSIFQILEEVDKWSIENPISSEQLYTVEGRVRYKNELWKKTSESWGESLSEHISKDLIKVLADDFAPKLAELIDSYIKSAEITIPKGQKITGSSGVITITGKTIDESPKANIK